MIERLLNRIPGVSGFMKATATLLSGTLVALIIAYVAQPILTRLYTPAAFGLFDTFVALLALLLPFASLRYEDAIMLPEHEEEALSVLGLTFLLVLIVGALSIGLTLYGEQLSILFGAEDLPQYLVWIPLALVIIRFTKLSELWLNRKKAYASISQGQVAQSATMASSRIGFGVVASSSSVLGLLWGYILGHITSLCWYVSRIFKGQPQFLKHAFNGPLIRKSARRFIQFPKYAMPSTFLIALQSRLPFILFLYFFDEATVGYFGRAFALFAVPLSLIGNAISQVFFVEGAEARRTTGLTALTEKVHHRLVTVGLFPTLAVIITGPQVMGFFLGTNWVQAGEFLQWLAPWFFLASIASPLTRLFDILEAQRTDFITSVVIFVVQMTLFIYGSLTGDLFTALLYLAIGGSLARVIHIVVMLKLAGVSFTQAGKTYLTQLFLSIPFCLILFFVSKAEIPWLTTLALALTMIVFLFIVYKQTVQK